MVMFSLITRFVKKSHFVQKGTEYLFPQNCVSALASATPRREKTSLITEYGPDIQT